MLASILFRFLLDVVRVDGILGVIVCEVVIEADGPSVGVYRCRRLESEFVSDRVWKGLRVDVDIEVAVDGIADVGVALMACPNVVTGIRVLQPLCEQQSTPGVLGKSLE